MIGLAQKEYVNHNGEKISAEKVEGVTTYNHIADGFYNWPCYSCGEMNGSRACGWPIAGQVLVCHKCEMHNLLLTSSTDDSNKGQKFAIEFDKEKSVIDAFKKRAEIAEEHTRRIKMKLDWIMSSLHAKMQNWLASEFSAIKEKVLKQFEGKDDSKKVD